MKQGKSLTLASSFKTTAVKSSFLLSFCLLLLCSVPFPGDSAHVSKKQILQNIKVPVFPNRIFKPKAFGAQGDGQNDDRGAIQAAIEACTQQGGGQVLLEPGTYLSNGPLHLKTGVNLHLAAGCQLLFGVNPADYTPLVKVRWEGTVCYNYSPLIYAYQQKNLAISGPGKIDGQTEKFWHAWKKGNNGKNQDADKPTLRQMGNDQVAETTRIFGNGFYDHNGDGQNDGDGKAHYLRPDLIQFYACENILLEDFSIKGSPFWTIHPVFCKNITARKLKIGKGTTNDDGIDPDSCEDVLIEDCEIHTNDDPISIKAGRDQDAWQRPGSRNIVVRRCRVSSEVGNGFCIGSEMSGGVENVFVENYYIKTADNGINFKCNLDRGGAIRQVAIENVKMDSCGKHGILFQMDYHSYRGGNFPPDFQGFKLRKINIAQSGRVGIKIVGVPSQSIRDVALENVVIVKTPLATEFKHTEGVRMKKVWVNGANLKP